MKISIAQLNYHVGNFEYNSNKIIQAIEKAKNEQSDLLIFSELSVCGYPPLDLLEQKNFVELCLEYIHKIASYCNGIAIVIGCPTINPNTKGKQLCNSALFIEHGKIKQTFSKTLLPTYDIFDEYRYFEPNNTFNILEFKGQKIAITICEDIWDKQVVERSFAKEHLYNKAPLDELIKFNPDFVINLAASPFSYNQEFMRYNVLKDNTLRYNLPIIYVNQVGANTEIIFDGKSKIINSKGQITKELAAFNEDFYSFNTELEFKSSIHVEQKETHKIETIHKALLLGIKDFFEKNNFKQAVIGLSGGIDSAVVAVLLAQALGKENLKVLLLPSEFSSEHSITDAIELAENLGIDYSIVPIKNIYNIALDALEPLFKDLPFSVAEENIQARIRGILLMGISNKFGNILINTSNKSEAAVGYSTMYGDMNGSLSVLGDVYKTDVFKLAEYLNIDIEIIPKNTIIKPPSAELRPNQKDSDSLPDYEILDGILFEYIEKKLSLEEIIAQGYKKETVVKTLRLVNNNEYKRFQFPPILRVSSKAFGFGRRIPLVAKHPE